MKFTAGYKYQLYEDEHCQLHFVRPQKDIDTEYIDLDVSGYLTIKEGYAWDGPSGPTLDTRNSQRGALIHDALYQLIREGYLLQDDRRLADYELENILKEDGMWWPRRTLWLRAVREFAGYAADPSSIKPILTAP